MSAGTKQRQPTTEVNSEDPSDLANAKAEKGSELTKDLAKSRLGVIYKAVRPILNIISQLSILPRKWRSTVKELINVLDAVCK